MPLVVIRRKKGDFKRDRALRLGDAMVKIVARHLKVAPREVEVRVRNFKRHDINCPTVGIEIDTGNGAKRWRLTERKQIALRIEKDLADTKLIPSKFLSPSGPYLWLRILGSAFVPIGFPQKAR